MKELSIQEATISLKSNHEMGLDFFFHKYYTPLCFFASSILNDQCLAEEITSESFLKLWEHRENFSTGSNIKSWLYSTVRNACIDHLRKVKRLRVNEQGLQTSNTIEQSVLHTIIETETIQHIIQALDLLPPKCRQVFRLFYIHGKSYDEIARELNLSRLTVRNQKQKAQRLLKKIMAGSLILLPFIFIFSF